ncbi:alpha/beta fold hydrolase [Jatrophihabitans telluris]|uniref:Alpha/beta fold hydrolase n=1 Tax=Jatrophihabitans telluris TaxID=2038343 RepID=A0ABY4QTS2_9ACTN|nr:alpha/beta fold hydrolase [Jatrophihabitans telluris]UQX87094.1 alpha/beta fold hydrolase [Jatrophihabitans telluris]
MFIHGLWIHATAWQPWQTLFTERGHPAHAPGWMGDSVTAAETRANPGLMAGLGVGELTIGYEKFISTLPDKPIVIGHSFGGLIAQKLLASGHAAAAAVISPAPIRGADKLPLAQIRSALPVLSRPGNKKRAVALSRRQFRFGFGNAISKDESSQLYDKFAIPGPGLPVFELTGAKKNPQSATAVNTTTGDRGPLLIIGAGRDHTVPEVVSRQAHGLYSASAAVTDYHVFPDRGHALVFDSRWHDVAEFALRWLSEHTPRQTDVAAADRNSAES